MAGRLNLRRTDNWSPIASHLPTVRAGQSALAGPCCGGRGADDFPRSRRYITPNWYPSKAESGKVVPTWNFAVVHAYGCPEVMNDEVWLRRHVTELTAQQECEQPKPWAPSDAPSSFIDAMLRGIVGFRFAITRLEGKWKMSQNRAPEDREGVVKGLSLRARGDDREIAELVSRQITPTDVDR